MMNNLDNEKMFTVKCSQEEFEHLQELFESGELNEILGVEVVDMGITSTEIPTKSIVLSQWLRGIIEPTWEVIKILGDTPVDNLAFPIQDKLKKQPNYFSISCKKTYNLGSYIDGNSLKLIVEVELIRTQGEINVNFRVQPCKNQPFLPLGLKLILFVGSDILAKVEAGSVNRSIEHGLTGEIGDAFSVKLALGDISVIEDFVI